MFIVGDPEYYGGTGIEDELELSNDAGEEMDNEGHEDGLEPSNDADGVVDIKALDQREDPFPMKLPREIIDIILSYLDHYSIKTVRLVSRLSL